MRRILDFSINGLFWSLLLLGCSILSPFGCSSDAPDKELLQRKVSIDSIDLFEYYATQGLITDPEKYEYLYNDIPVDVSEIVKIVQGVLISPENAKIQGIKLSKRRERREINIRRVEEMLGRIGKLDNRAITFVRLPEKRLIGYCRHFAVLTCSILRHKNIPARTRGGFETHHSTYLHHDHWICEYWHPNEQRWVQVDAEIDPILNREWEIEFDIFDLPQGTFMTGAEAWLMCRSGKKNPDQFGVMGDEWAGGWFFVKNELLLDFMALNKLELLPWDGNKLSETEMDKLSDAQLILLDSIANLIVAGNDVFSDIRTIYETNPSLRMPDNWSP